MITEQTAQAFCSAVKGEIQRRAGAGSPMHESIRGYPSNVDEQAASTIERSDDSSRYLSGRSPHSAHSPPPRAHGAGSRTRSNLFNSANAANGRSRAADAAARFCVQV